VLADTAKDFYNYILCRLCFVVGDNYYFTCLFGTVILKRLILIIHRLDTIPNLLFFLSSSTPWGCQKDRGRHAFPVEV
jgi:hypothetical protein